MTDTPSGMDWEHTTVLFVAHGGGYVLKPLLPLADHLDKLGARCEFILFKYEAGVLQRIQDQIHNRELSVYPNRPDLSVDWRFRLLDGLGVFPKRLFLASKMRDLSELILDSLHPDVLFLTGDTGIGNSALVNVANRRGLPTILVQWAFTMPRRYYREFHSKAGTHHPKTDEGPLVHLLRKIRSAVSNRLALTMGLPTPSEGFGGGEARCFAVMGDAFVKQFTEQGVDSDKIAVTGCPAHDALANLSASPFEKKRLRRTLDLPPGRLIVFATSPLSPIVGRRKHRSNIALVIDTVLRETDCGLLVKLHPRDDVEDDLFEKCGPRVKVYRDGDIVQLIQVADLFVTGASTTALFAMALEKPIITVNFTPWSGGDYFSKSGSVLHVTDPASLGEALNEALEDEDVRQKIATGQRRFVSEYMKVDGQACARLCALAEREIIESRCSSSHRQNSIRAFQGGLGN